MRQRRKARSTPVVGRILGSLQATATMTRDHVEVSRITELLGWLLSQTPTAFDLEQMKNVRRKVHFAKEEEIYLPLLESQLSGGAANRLLHKWRN